MYYKIYTTLKSHLQAFQGSKNSKVLQLLGLLPQTPQGTALDQASGAPTPDPASVLKNS
jgi:hypothetical protein